MIDTIPEQQVSGNESVDYTLPPPLDSSSNGADIVIPTPKGPMVTDVSLNDDKEDGQKSSGYAYSISGDDSMVADNDIPLTAADDELIEKEWVEKAKDIIAKTKNDPYKRELEIGKLQIAYLSKRYGRTLEETNK